MARKTGAIHIRSDAVRKHLAGIALDSKGSAALYSAEITERTYQRLLDLGLMLAKSGYSVILDATYPRRDLRLAALRGAQAAGLAARMIQCVAPPDVLRERLAGRHGDISDATPDLLESQQKTFEPFGEDECAYLEVIDTSKHLESR